MKPRKEKQRKHAEKTKNLPYPFLVVLLPNLRGEKRREAKRKTRNLRGLIPNQITTHHRSRWSHHTLIKYPPIHTPWILLLQFLVMSGLWVIINKQATLLCPLDQDPHLHPQSLRWAEDRCKLIEIIMIILGQSYRLFLLGKFTHRIALAAEVLVVVKD